MNLIDQFVFSSEVFKVGGLFPPQPADTSTAAHTHKAQRWLPPW